jgi:hypothetical protein
MLLFEKFHDVSSATTRDFVGILRFFLKKST